VTVAFALTLGGLGLLGGLIAGLVGVGGAIVMIPLLYYGPPWLGVGRFDLHEVAGITMVQVFVASVSGVLAHRRARTVHSRLTWVGGVSMATTSFLGALASRYMSERSLLLVFALMATGAALMLFKLLPAARDAVLATEVELDWLRAVLVAGGVGTIAGLVGAGGAFLLLPLLIFVVGVPIRVAIGSSLGIVALASVTGVVGKAITGQVLWLPALVVAAAALVGAQGGAAGSRRLSGSQLKQLLGLVVIVSALRAWWDLLQR
jgi:uncharacterized membrane protein YfcA